MQLSENMVAANLVNRDFEPTFANFGDVVNTRRPSEMKAYRKARASNITLNDAVATNVPVPLDQHIHTSFLIHDSDMTKSFAQLEAEFIVPAMRALARQIDLTIVGQAYAFRGNLAGKLGTAPTIATVLQEDAVLNASLCPPDGRNMIVCPATKADLLAIDAFNKVNESGSTQGLFQASIGKKFGFDFYMAQNVPHTISTLQTLVTGAINGGNLAIGSTVLTVNGFTGDAVPVGSYVTIAGDMTIQRVTAASLTSGNTTSITVTPGLKSAVLTSAVVTKVKTAALGATYAAGYAELISYTGLTSGDAIQVGALVSFGTSATVAEYVVTAVVNSGAGAGTIQLDRPLEAQITSSGTVNIGPTGNVNFAFHKNALTLAIRPLAAPRPGSGTNAATASDPRLGASVRVAFTYDPYLQATVVTCDFLAGIKVLDTNLGAVMYA
jgi:hypothetical protein